MTQPALPFHLEPMRPADIPEVVALEIAAYGPHWNRIDYPYELEGNRLAHYIVLRLPSLDNLLVGHAGFWLIADETHLNTIVVHPAWRRLGLSQWLLLTVIEQGQRLGARETTLEVRLSNQAAIALYQKFSFEQVGLRRRYYSDNGEDGLIMTTPPIDSPDYQTLLQQRKAALHLRLPALIDKIGQLG